MKKHLRVPVRELVALTLRSGDLVLDSWGASRPLDGIRAHQKIQKSRPEEYESEVTVSQLLETEHYKLEVSGRIDGVYQYPDRVIIDEIKTTTRNLETLAQSENRQHWGQAKVYAYIYAVREKLDSIEVQLTYYQIDTGQIRELSKIFTQAQLEIFFSELVTRYLQWAEALEAWRRTRDESIRSLVFPFPSYRPGQRKIAVEAYRTTKEGGQITVQAPTGIGKTMAVVFSALKACGEGATDRLFYLTARTTGRTIAQETLDTLRAGGLKLRSVTLTAKDKICFNPEKSCNGDECEFARGYYDRIDFAVEDAFHRAGDGLDREAIETQARKHRVCPFELSLDLSLGADCIIGDYNYAFDPTVYLRRFFDEENGNNLFLVDEAHNLVDRAREMFSAELRKRQFLELRRFAKKTQPQIYKAAGKVNSWFLKARKRTGDDGAPWSEAEPPEGLAAPLAGFIRAAEIYLVAHRQPGSGKAQAFRDKLIELYFDAARFARVAEQFDDSYSTCYEPADKDLRVKLFCMDPSTQMGQALERCKTAVFFSATMTPSGYFRRIFGCKESAKELILPSPFPSENFRVLVTDTISTLYRQRNKTKHEVEQAIARFVKQKKGNYLLFFPSYEYMGMIYSLFEPEGNGVEILVQSPAMSEEERDRFVEKFKAENQHTLVGFAVMGGLFGEGIDLVGDRLTGAAIVGVGLPGISPERELIRKYFDRWRAGFEYAYLFPGINRVLQAAGRVIRSETDRGAVLLIDERFSRARYRSLFPPEWAPKRLKNNEELREALADFWGIIPPRSLRNLVR